LDKDVDPDAEALWLAEAERRLEELRSARCEACLQTKPLRERAMRFANECRLSRGGARRDAGVGLVLRGEIRGPRVDFLNAVEQTSQRLFPPQSRPVWRGDVRKRLVAGFPFTLLYSIEPDQIFVVAVAHQIRRPGYWLKRVHGEPDEGEQQRGADAQEDARGSR